MEGIETYQVVSDENELKWFFDHVIHKPELCESYSMVLVSRHKKLTEEEKEAFGMTRRESEFLRVETVRCSKVKSMDMPAEFTFDNFIRHVRGFNVDKRAHMTRTGTIIPERTMTVLFYVNPCNELKVARKVTEKVSSVMTDITMAAANGKGWDELGQLYQGLCRLDSDVKHFRAQCKGNSYWMDFDIDVPNWFRFGDLPYHIEGDTVYHKAMLACLDVRFGKGNYVIVSTSGGYHVLVRTSSIRSNPHDFRKEVREIYEKGLKDGQPEYDKFECNINDSQIPGLPLPGTFQYGRPVTVLNKEDFE